MKVVILAGGLGARLSKETASRPKPMVEIKGRPILWHIMKLYSAHGIDDFIIAGATTAVIQQEVGLHRQRNVRACGNQCPQSE